MVTILVTQNEAGSRIDRLLRKKFPLKTLADIYRMIRTGFVRVNTKRVKENHRLCDGDVISIRINEAELSHTKSDTAERFPDLHLTDFYRRNLKILYEDDALIACNKPPHLVVHSGTNHEGNATLIDLVKCYMAIKKYPDPDADPVLVHRLDRDTSGVILVAKNKGVVRKLHEILRNHDIDKQYIAICHGSPTQNSGMIEANLLKTLEQNAGTKMSVDPAGVFAKTEYHVVSKSNLLSNVNIKLHTGRTHQIRVHMAHIGCPLLGDVRYGDKALDAAIFAQQGITKRLYLHAAKISFKHPVDNRDVAITAPEPDEFITLCQ